MTYWQYLRQIFWFQEKEKTKLYYAYENKMLF